MEFDNFTAAHIATVIMLPAVVGLWVELVRTRRALDQARKDHMADLRAMRRSHERIRDAREDPEREDIPTDTIRDSSRRR